jgi:HSP20 family protein
MFHHFLSPKKEDYVLSIMRRKRCTVRIRTTAPVITVKLKEPRSTFTEQETSYEMLVFAPGRIKENFTVQVKGNELHVSYTPPEGFPKSDWVLREYSRGGFLRIFNLDETIDAGNISAKYIDGVLQVSLPVIAGAAPQEKKVNVD